MNGYGYRRRGSGILLFVLYLIFGAYFINYPFNLIPIPASIIPTITSINKWIILAGGILIVIGAINHLRLNRYRRYGYS